MKRSISIFLVVLLLLSCMITGSPQVYAAQKASESRAIGIVFDNSGSMYMSGRVEWCRATYAMEVFASMLNKGDILQIYPMYEITVDGKKYDMDNPLQITDASQASKIRDIYTPYAGGTPIESIDAAAKGLKTVKADKKYMIVLTDGSTFHMNDIELSVNQTRDELNKRFKEYAGSSLTVMYLGIGQSSILPGTKSEYYTEERAGNSDAVLSTLTTMCNQIFGRDTLPKNHISGKKVDFDISMKKLIVFVQGENIANLKVTGSSGLVGTQISTASTKFGTEGCGDYKFGIDESLQGMMVTYTDCAAGNYNIEYSGTASSVEIYYEPDADLSFVFTDAKGKTVDPKTLYEGDYMVSFGMVDAQTGKLIESDLLGKPKYEGSYILNGKEYPITSEGYSGNVSIPLKMNDTFEADLTVTYLSGYTIRKDSTDFGWPEGGIIVLPRPPAALELVISGGEDLFSLQHLEEGKPYTVKVYYDNNQLTGKELEKVGLTWDEGSSNARLEKELADDHFTLCLRYKDANAPQNTVCGQCSVPLKATYTPQGSNETATEETLSYNIKDDFSPLQIELFAPEDYIVISELEGSQPMTVKLFLNGKALTAEEFGMVKLQVDSDIEHTLNPLPEKSAYEIKLLPTDGIAEGDYPVRIVAEHTDLVGRTTQVEDELVITLSNMPLWLKWVIGLSLLLLLILLIYAILHIRVLPKKGDICNKRDCTMTFDGDDVTEDATFRTELTKKTLTVWAKHVDTKVGVKMEVKPGKNSYLYKPSKKRSIEVKSTSVKAYGSETIKDAAFNYSNIYELNPDNGKLERVPEDPNNFEMNTGSAVSFSGLMLGKSFAVTMQLNYKKK